MAPLAASLQLDSVLAPLTAVLRDGNESSRWLARQRQGESIRAIISSEARAMEKRDIAQLASVATDRTPLLG
jgi:gamma-glutamyl:cysteine ligase YbdK (ATP-grasp superfamily)